MIDVERNDDIYDAELLAIVASCCHWDHELEQLYQIMELYTDHSTMRAFISMHKIMQS